MKKSIWGPVEVNGKSQFPIYRDLGVGIFQIGVRWDAVARSRPASPRDPGDPAYTWPAEVDRAVEEGRRHGIRVAIQLVGAPRWANGDRAWNWAPRQPSDFADFAAAASRRYSGVRHWMIWGEPSRRANFMPLVVPRSYRRLTRAEQRGPRLYARILDGAYAALKGVHRRNLVIGGMTFTAGDIRPRTFISALRLPDGRPPRMDLYGHNPLGVPRRPDLRKGPVSFGMADFSELDSLAVWVDRWLGRPRGRRRMKLFLSEYFLPTDHRNSEFDFYVSHRVQASWLGAVLRQTRRWPRIYTLGWLSLYDDRPDGRNLEVNRGLIDRRGRKKRAYYVYRRG